MVHVNVYGVIGNNLVLTLSNTRWDGEPHTIHLPDHWGHIKDVKIKYNILTVYFDDGESLWTKVDGKQVDGKLVLAHTEWCDSKRGLYKYLDAMKCEYTPNPDGKFIYKTTDVDRWGAEVEISVYCNDKDTVSKIVIGDEAFHPSIMEAYGLLHTRFPMRDWDALNVNGKPVFVR